MSQPYQLKLVTGQTCLAFLDEPTAETPGFYTATAACSMSFNRESQNYHVSEVMDPIANVELSSSSLVIRQKIKLDSSVALIYASYLASWELYQRRDKEDVPSFVPEFIKSVSPYYARINQGVSVYTRSLINFHEELGNSKEAAYFKEQEEKEKKAFSGKAGKENPPVSCGGTVVAVDFVSKHPKPTDLPK